MIRTLFIIAGSAFLLCIIAFGGAAALGGADIQRNGWSFVIDEQDGRTAIRRSTSVEVAEGPETTRTVPWAGGETLTLDLAADVTFVQGDAANVVITGPEGIVNRVRIDGGRLQLEEGSDRVVVSVDGMGVRGWSDSERLRIVVTAPSVKRFDLRGSSDLIIQDYDQAEMTLDISGSGDVEAQGTATRLALDITGSGDAELRDLTVTDAEIDISGTGDARVDATGKVQIDLTGSGDVDLESRPASLTQNISGTGDVAS